ncbi:MAG: YlxR family protein [Chloroflexota bacterium]
MKRSKTDSAPERTCVGCRQARPKWQMVRLVRAPGGVEIDPRGKKSGRGAYLCQRGDCWARGLKGDGLSHVLRAAVTAENLQALQEYGQQLYGGGAIESD